MSPRSPALMFALALAMLALGALIALRLRPSTAPHEPPRAEDPDQPIAAFVGELAALDGGLWSACLSPLHADAERQAFEAASMRERLDMSDGEPWRLALRWDAGDRAQASKLALGSVEVRDEEGTALRSIPVAAPGASPDPLRTLVGAPSGDLGPGQAIDWVLWGRAPSAGAVLHGALDDRLVFQRGSVRRSELSLPLARVDPGARQAGKKPGEAASKAGDDGQDSQRH